MLLVIVEKENYDVSIMFILKHLIIPKEWPTSVCLNSVNKLLREKHGVASD